MYMSAKATGKINFFFAVVGLLSIWDLRGLTGKVIFFKMKRVMGCFVDEVFFGGRGYILQFGEMVFLIEIIRYFF